MTNLTRYEDQEIAEIVEDAILVTPRDYHTKLMKPFSYLALCYVQERDEAHLADIQSMIDAAKAHDAVALARMEHQLNAEIQQLRGDMMRGFEKVAECLEAIRTDYNSRCNAIEERLASLEQQAPLEPQVIYVQEQAPVTYYIDNSYRDNSRRTYRNENTTVNGGNIEALAWTIVILFFMVLICSLVPSTGRR